MTIGIKDSNGSYTLPHDAPEIERLTRQHHVWKALTGGSNFAAPLPEDRSDISILDCGTGNGIWALDAIEELRQRGFKRIDAVGFDMTDEKFPSELSLQATLKGDTKDANDVRLHLLVYDLLDELPESFHERFDIINIRLVLFWNHTKFWPKIIQNLRACLKPGGYLQDQETALFLSRESRSRAKHTLSAIRYCIAHLFAAGNDGPRLDEWYRAKRGLPDLLEEQGWLDIRTHHYEWPASELSRGHHHDSVIEFTKNNLLLITRLGIKTGCFGHGLFEDNSNGRYLKTDTVDDSLDVPYIDIPKDAAEVEELARLLEDELRREEVNPLISIVTARRPWP